jgi:Putative Ig domain
VSAACLPPGLTYDTLTKTISGTPTTPGVYTVTMTASNLLPPATSRYSFLWTIK